MIYALKDKGCTSRKAIEGAILEHDCEAIKPFAGRDIIHILDAAKAAGPFFCTFCLDEVFPTTARPPAARTAKNPWHFQHRGNNKCIGVINPARHGCYVALGCENVPDRGRRSCRTIDRHGTYCHWAQALGCV